MKRQNEQNKCKFELFGKYNTHFVPNRLCIVYENAKGFVFLKSTEF